MTPPISDPDRRLLALEERLTFHERQVEELNEVVLQQRAELDRLARELATCRATVGELTLQGENLPHEKPPHY